MTEENTAAEMERDNDILPGEEGWVPDEEDPKPEPDAEDGKVEKEDEETAGKEEEKGKEGDDKKPKRETAKERRERDKQYKQKLRDEANEARAAREEAEQKRQRILDAGAQEKAPEEKDFEDYTEYVAAKAVWRHAQQAAQREMTEADTAAEQARQKEQAIQRQEKQLLAQHWSEQARAAQGKYQDFQEVVAADGLFPADSHLPDLVMSSDVAGDLAYAVASDRNLHDTLLRMSPVEASRELGRIEARLTSPQPRTQSNAPEPISPVRPKASASKDPAKMSFAEYKAWRNKGET